jgi:murein DD-endopeptidase MepM/ murein hydrolase activator NlpD
VDLTSLGGGGGSITTAAVVGGYARSLTLDPIGRILLTGPAFTTHVSQMTVLRLTGTGELDPTFGGDGAAFVTFDGMVDADAFGILRNVDDTIVVAGAAFAPQDGGYFAVGRLLPNGTRYSVLSPATSIPSGARVKLPFPFNNFPRKQTPAVINVRVQFAEIAQPLFITGIAPIFYETNARPYRFPLQNPAIGLWRPGQGHDIAENHYGNPSQRYAYDISVYDPETDATVRDDCDVAALVAQYANDPRYDYEIDPNGSYSAGNFAECALAYGEPIRAAAAGRVVRATDGFPNNFPVGTKLPELYLADGDPAKIGGGGNSVVIRHDNGEFTFYGHMRPGSVQVTTGQQVVAGQVLGEVGNTGSSQGTHLHFHLMDDYVPAPHGPPGIAQGPLPTPGHGTGLPVYFYDVAFARGAGQPVMRQLRSGFNRHTRLDIASQPVPLIDIPAPEYGPGTVGEVEPNHTLANAQRLALPVEVHGAIATSEPVELADAGDGLEDLYRFHLPQSRVVLARLTFDDGEDLDVQLVNGLLHPFEPQMGTRLHNPEVVIASLPAGTHYVFVSRFDGAGAGSAPYTLELEVFGSRIAAFLDALGIDAWKNPGQRQVMMIDLSRLQREVADGRFERASALIARLSEAADGCARSGAPDRGDTLESCEAQRSLQAMLLRLSSDLDAIARQPPVR